jgi:hypothetical protein
MPKLKTDTLTFRVEPRIKRALAAAAKHERRSLANMLEVMVLEYCYAHVIKVPSADTPRPATVDHPAVGTRRC